MTSVPPTSPSSQPRRREPALAPPAYVLNKHNSRVLDPDTAVKFPGQILRPTVYVASDVLVRAQFFAQAEPLLAQAAGDRVDLVVTEPDERMLAYARENQLGELVQSLLSYRVTFRLTGDRPSVPPDAWTILQNYRALAGRGSVLARAVTLNHLLSAGGIDGAPKVLGSGLDGVPKVLGSGLTPSDEYATIGYGGRQPVNWIGPELIHRSEEEVAKECGRRPVVAVLDTGAGKHSWLPESIVDRHVMAGATAIGLIDPVTAAEVHPSETDPLEGTLDSDAGHGTFIAGLIRQKCPDAKILAVRVMYGDGAVAEKDLLDALTWLLLRHVASMNAGKTNELIDVISLSFGYYHEEPADLAYDQQLLVPLQEFSRLGVVTVAAAGNDATSRHFYPAGFAPHPGGQVQLERDCVPLISVGARNPNGDSTALFSNAGDWVVCERPGAAVVSCLPTTFNGALQPSARVIVAGYGERETIDPDDFRGGFAVWSGTSFSAPIFAGEVAQYLVDTKFLGTAGSVSSSDARDRGWAAISKLTLDTLERP